MDDSLAKLLADSDPEILAADPANMVLFTGSVAGLRALFKTHTGNKLFADRIWRLGNLYFFKHVATGEPINLDLEEPYLLELLNGIHGNNNTLRILVTKPRQVFITTFSSAIALDLCIRSRDIVAGISNYSEDECQRTIQEKLHYAVDHSPFLQMQGVEKYSAGIFFPKTNSRITVSQTGRGRTLQFTLITEFAQTSVEDPQKAKRVRNGILAASEHSAVIVESSPRGPSGEYYDLCETAHKNKVAGIPLDRKSFDYLFISWAQKKLNKMDYCAYETSEFNDYFKSVEKSQDLILVPEQKNWWVSTFYNDFSGSATDMAQEHPGTFEEAWQTDIEAYILLNEMRRMTRENRVLPLFYNPQYPVLAHWDLGWKDHTAVIFAQENDGGGIDIIGGMRKNETVLDWFFEQISALGYPILWHILPADADKQNEHVNHKLIPGSTTIAKFFRRAGKYNIKIQPQVRPTRAGFEASKQFSKMCRINNNMEDFLKCLVSVKRRYVAASGSYVDELPKHADPNHYYDCFENCARAKLDWTSLFSTSEGIPASLRRDAAAFRGENEGLDTMGGGGLYLPGGIITP